MSETITATDGALAELLLVRSVERFLVLEAELLDDARYRDWLNLLHDDILYRAPVRVSRRSDGRIDEETMFWFDENRATLELRVRRLETDVNWAEQPPSRTRRIVGNVRAERGENGQVMVRSNLLCHRNRKERAASDLLAAERRDLLVPSSEDDDADWRIMSREIRFDHGTLGTKNLALLF